MLPGRYYRSYNPYEHYYSSERDYLLAELEQQEQKRRYQTSLEEQAYLEALERKRQNKLAEERRRKQYRYLLELEQRRQEQEEEEKRRQQQQQYLSNLAQNQRRQKWREERIRNEKAATLEELKRKEEMRKQLNNLFTNQTIDPKSRIIKGTDGNLYRILMDSSPINSRRNNCTYSNSEKVDMTTDNNDGKSPASSYVKPFNRKNHEYSSSAAKMDCLDDNTVDQLNTSTSEENINKDYKRKKVVPRKIVKSSILIGDVEDASDSECEDEYSDYMHTRRPQPGQWIEPIGYMTN